jgi:hypothetical protein
MQAAKPENKSAPSTTSNSTTADGDLPFARALASRGEPREMTRGQLGINELRKIFADVNTRLSDTVRLEKAPTGHSGRVSFISNCMNAGAGASAVGASSKHTNMEVLNGYIAPDDGFLCQASRVMGGAVLAAGNHIRSAPAGSQQFAESEPEEEEEKEEVPELESDKENSPKQLKPRAYTPKKQVNNSSKRAGTPAPSKAEKTKRAGTPVASKSAKVVTWASDVDSDSPETKRRTAHNGGGGGSSSGYKNTHYNGGKAMEESEDEEDEGAKQGGIHIHLHMGSKKGKR